MKITRESDYALRIMRCLAVKGKLTDAKTVSEEARVPLRFTIKILSKLVNGNVVKSRKGVNGGYALNGAPKDISMRMIIEIIEGPLTISPCLSDDFKCEHDGCDGECSCFYNHVFDDINYIISEKLDKISLKDVVAGSSGGQKHD